MVGAAERNPMFSGIDFLKVKPARNPYVNWKRTKKGVMVYAYGKKIDLDNIGATVWEACDGRNTVEDIARILNGKYMMTVGEAETSLSIYFEQLVKKGLVFMKLEMQTRVEEPPERPPYGNVFSASDGATIFCGYCGAQNPRISNFCLKCGQRLVK